MFVGVGLLALSLATSRIGCFDELRTVDGSYLAVGGVTSSPELPGAAPPKAIGTTLVGLATRRVYGPPGTDVSDPRAPRPTEISVECGDGTYRGYRLGSVSPSAS